VKKLSIHPKLKPRLRIRNAENLLLCPHCTDFPSAQTPFQDPSSDYDQHGRNLESSGNLTGLETIYRKAIEATNAVPYQQLFQNQGDSTRIIFSYIGEGIRNLTGYGPEEFTFEILESLTLEKNPIDELRSYSYVKAIEKVRSNDSPYWKCEYLIRTREGKLRWLFEASVDQRDKDGIAIGSIGVFQDITQRKIAEKTLRDSEALYRRSIEVAGAVPYKQDFHYTSNGIEPKFSFIGEGIHQITGYGPEEMTGELMDSLILESHLLGDLAPYSMDEAIELVRAGTIPYWKCENLIRARDGSLHWIFETAVDHRDEDGMALSSLGVFQDITQNKKAEINLRESEAIYRKAIEVADSVPYRQVFHDVDGQRKPVFDFLGEGIRQLTGYGPDEFTSEIFDSILLESHTMADLSPYSMNEAVAMVREGHAPYWKCEYLIRARDGSLRWVFDAAVDQYDENGVVTGSVGVFQDITQRKLADDALRKSEAKYRAVIENGQEGILFIDSKARILYRSPSMVKIDGFVDDGTVGHHAFEQVYPEDLAILLSSWERIIWEPETPITIEHRIIRSDGKIRWLETSAQNLLNNPNIEAVVIISHDITERKLADEQIKKALAEKETLLRELYHRTKNNMGVINALLGLQASYFEDKRLRHAFEETQNRIRSMALVHQKLYESKDLSFINLKDYINDLTELMTHTYAILPSQVRFEVDMEDVHVLIDTAIPCGLILSELISNALKYAFPEGRSGKIQVHLHRLANGEIELGVCDDGVGFPEDFDVRGDGHMGMQTLFILAESQLMAKVDFKTRQGVSFQMQFKDNLYEARV
jgi:PAS domain S-box-containing protein